MYKVMIVDDEDIIVSGLVKVMPWAKYGCEVAATASDGLAAQAVLREKRPDILFTDICMPGADGLALLAAVRSEFPDMQVTILSGFPDFEYAQRAIGLASAVQDALNQTARGVLFASVKDVVTGTLAPEEAIETALATPLADS